MEEYKVTRAQYTNFLWLLENRLLDLKMKFHELNATGIMTSELSDSLIAQSQQTFQEWKELNLINAPVGSINGFFNVNKQSYVHTLLLGAK